MLLVAVLGIATLKLVVIQSFQAPDLNAASARQLLTEIPLPAERGPILDSAGKPLAFSIEANALVTNPRTIARTHGAGTAEYVTRMASADRARHRPGPRRAAGVARPRQGLRRAGQARRPRRREGGAATSSRRSRRSAASPASTPADRSPRTSSASRTWDATDTPGKLTGRIGLESSQDNLLSGSNGVREVDTAEGSSAP